LARLGPAGHPHREDVDCRDRCSWDVSWLTFLLETSGYAAA
jgi:hypothetical protein